MKKQKKIFKKTKEIDMLEYLSSKKVIHIILPSIKNEK